MMIHQRGAVPGGEWGRVGGGDFFFKWKYLRILKCYQEGSSAIGEVDASREGASMIRLLRRPRGWIVNYGLTLDELL